MHACVDFVDTIVHGNHIYIHAMIYSQTKTSTSVRELKYCIKYIINSEDSAEACYGYIHWYLPRYMTIKKNCVCKLEKFCGGKFHVLHTYIFVYWQKSFAVMHSH